ncbi:16S rRNA (guanine(966)-N(2))-methyltransferase RsmD [Piscibacillus salipiscarius]|uniref:16S rRNA (Guanine(966)-N(2))-methyltransferase RsmD n=1 Tax=Piscibacillus salipiscarius TaxID=299480 RepID=A0ABW5Q8I7_9BACI|nr:16S rRNA (guanine(966)-N(2))-methyltransferase RsmD [Piscibacillus salipiscarius]
MRVIAGTLKGHPIQAVPSKKTRPTTDKIKEALFQIIGPFFEGGRALDLFAGSGNLGIEAISRGMEWVTFVDHQYHAIQTIKSNVKDLDIEKHCEIFRNDAFRAIKAAGKRDKTYHYIFLDPPYQKAGFKDILIELDEHQLMEDGCLIICEHTQDEKLPDSFERFTMLRQDEYGSLTELTIYRYDKGDGNA